jgi:peptide/nickel transport system substrate-binding protein
MSHRAWLLGCSSFLVAGLFALTFSDATKGLNAQPGPKKMREEEEEPEKSKVPAKVDDVVPKSPQPGVRQPPPPPQGNFNIAQEAAKTKNPVVRDFLRRIAIPYDMLVSAAGKTYKIGLLPDRQLPEGKLTYLALNDAMTSGKEKELASTAGFSLQPYEEIVLEDVDSFLKKKVGGVKRDEMMELCVQVLQATRRFHAFAIDQKKRAGKGWEAADERLRKRVVQLRRDQLESAVKTKDWTRADELSLELSNYADDPEAEKDIYRLLLRKELESLNPERDEDYLKLRDALTQFENIVSGGGEDIAKTARRMLTGKAQQLVARAKKLDEQKQPAESLKLLKAAEALAPELPAISQLRAGLRDRILYVGVPRLPDYMSPARARTDTERWAVDLLFESLMQAVPDAELGRHYRPMLAASMPALVPMGRDFSLLRNARWTSDGRPVDARDVYGTLELLRKIPAISCAEGLDVLDTDKVRIDDPFRLRLGFRQGVLEPLNRTTFKVLPARWLQSQKKGADDDMFGRNPFGSGPYKYEGREQEGPDREVAVFRANPFYSQRPGKFGLPNIREVRLVVPKLSTAAADFASGQLHMVLDVPTGDLPRYVDDPRVAGRVKAEKAAINRRIWVIAINHRKTPLQSDSLRRGLSAAIDREKILNIELFRPGGVKSHQSVLTGPFPLNCWATPEKARKAENALFSRDLAAGLFAEAVPKGTLKLTLCYPESDNQANVACVKIKEQIEEASKRTAADPPSIEIMLSATPAENFHRRIEQEQDFELAYLPIDYKDDLYWLGGMFDPAAAGIGQRNFLGYLAPGSNPKPDDNDLRILIEEIRAHRDFRARIREETWKLHTKFLNRMPFVPLWQLDRNVVVQRGLEMFLDDPSERIGAERIDPAAAFTGVELWRLK